MINSRIDRSWSLQAARVGSESDCRNGRPRYLPFLIGALWLILAVAVNTPASMQTAFAAAAVEAQTEMETLRVDRGDSLSLLLSRAGVRGVDVDRISKAIQKKTNLRRMRVGREVRLLFRMEGEGRRIPVMVSVETGQNRYVEATRDARGRYSAHRTTLPLARPVRLTAVALRDDGRRVTVRRNDTLGGILRRNGVDGPTVDAIVRALRDSFDPRDLMPGNAVTIAAARDAGGDFVVSAIALHLDGDNAVAVVRTADGGFAAQRTTRTAHRTATSTTATAPAAKAEAELPRRPGAVNVDAKDVDGSGATTQAFAGPKNPPKPELVELRRTLRADSTLMDVLLDADVRRPDADALVQSLRRVFNPRRLPAGITVQVVKRRVPGFEPRTELLDIELPQGRHIRVEREEKRHFSNRVMEEPALPPVKPGAVADAAAADRAVVDPGSRARPVAPAPLPPSATVIKVRSGDTLMAILRRQGIDRVEADRAIQAARTLINLRRLKIGQEITLVTGTDETGADTLKAVALRVGDDRYVRVSRAADNHFEADRVSRLAFVAAPLERTAAASSVPDVEGRQDRADVVDRGNVMNGAFVAAAAPFSTVLPGVEPQGAADPQSGAVNGVVNGTMNGAVIDALDDIGDRHLAPDNGLVRKAVVIRKGDTLSAALTRAGGTREEAEAAIVAFRKVHNPRRLRVGQTLSLAFDPANGSNGTLRLASLVLDVAPDRAVVVSRGDDDFFLPSVVEQSLDRILQRTGGTIDSNLYDAALAAGMPNQVLMEMVHIFSFDVDFQREIQRGDRFEVLYEAAFNKAGEFVENGPILYATLEIGEREVELFRYELDEGPADYLDAKGASVRKALLRTPIDGARLSSGYGMRKHPILGYNKKHLGVDFAAPTGTPIYAAGDGTITIIGRHGNAGNYIRIRHNGTYNTSYSHLSGFAEGMKQGKRVRQGQVIGYVGSTGLSTGPHLHYEVMRGSNRINPMTLKLPSGRKLEGNELAAFQRQVMKIAVILVEAQKVN
ncbi:MAG: peptidoglycan DD-metalloendopeptidase family protein [Rhodospirillales bacterium]|nr:peptidoglycan DD-metalloendopeptidase family protein [Rhodospirillales bacterium]